MIRFEKIIFRNILNTMYKKLLPLVMSAKTEKTYNIDDTTKIEGFSTFKTET